MAVRVGRSVALFAAVTIGCFQEVDTGVVNGPLLSFGPGEEGGLGQGREAGSAAGSGSEDPPSLDAETLPSPFRPSDVDAALTGQCEAGSELCYQLCGSPSCSLADNTIPAELATSTILLPEGGTATSACAQVDALSLQIRQRSCAPCHGPPPAAGPNGLNFILSDQQLVSQTQIVGGVAVVTPGDPLGSLLYQRVLLGLSGSAIQGMPPPASVATGYLSPQAQASLVHPTSEDLSILYAWILNCVPGTDGGAYASSYYGGNYAPDAAAGANAAPADAGHN
jgi:hypothetical protein